MSEASRARLRAYQKEWRIANREKCAAYTRKYASKYPDRARAAVKSWKSRNKQYFSASEARRRAIKNTATPGWADDELMGLVYAEAAYRGLEVDHVVPLRGANVCGLHVYYNTQLLTKKQNQLKGNRFDGSATYYPVPRGD